MHKCKWKKRKLICIIRILLHAWCKIRHVRGHKKSCFTYLSFPALSERACRGNHYNKLNDPFCATRETKCTFPLKARDIYRKIAWKQQTKNTTLSKLKISHSFTMWRIITLTLYYHSGKLSGLIWSWWGSEEDKASNYSQQQTSDYAHRRQRVKDRGLLV